jgi:hypothetical protein
MDETVHSTEVSRLRDALQLIADGVMCEELFPGVTDDYHVKALTAQTIALAALAHETGPKL